MKEKKELVNINADRDCFVTLKRWLENRNEGKSFEQYFKACNYYKVGIYGAGDLGHLLYAELKNSDIQIQYFVDRNAEGLAFVECIPVISIGELKNQQEVDVLVVTPVGNYSSICSVLAEIYPELAVISLKDVVYEM